MGFALGGRAGAILMRRAFLLVLVASCTFEWNSGAPPFPLSGDPPPLTSFEKLNTMPAARATIMQGPDGQPWVAFCEFWAGNITGSRNNERLPVYYQIDLRLDREWIYQRWALALFVEVLNLTYSESIYGVTFPKDPTLMITRYDQPQFQGFRWVLPSVGVRGRF